MKSKWYLLLAVGLVFFELSYAATETGYIDYIIVRDSDGLVYFGLKESQLEGQKPACASKSYWMIRDENSATGQQQLSVLLSAQMAGKKITVYGYDQCTRWGDGEDVNAIRLRF